MAQSVLIQDGILEVKTRFVSQWHVMLMSARRVPCATKIGYHECAQLSLWASLPAPGAGGPWPTSSRPRGEKWSSHLLWDADMLSL